MHDLELTCKLLGGIQIKTDLNKYYKYNVHMGTNLYIFTFSTLFDFINGYFNIRFSFVSTSHNLLAIHHDQIPNRNN